VPLTGKTDPIARILALALMGVVPLWASAATPADDLASQPPPAASSNRRTPVALAVSAVTPAVVSITSEKLSSSSTRWPFSPEENQRPRISGMGTGVLIDERGFILTNQHVVDRVEGIEVHLADGSAYPARVVQQDPTMDIALIKVDAGRALPTVRVGTSSDLMVGETVITIGNAFGYEGTTSTGIISALHRDVRLSDDQEYRNLIQTDACINPGNSGGPLVNIDGELIGINVAVRAGAQGIGFALPIDDVKRVALDMLSTRRLAATWHGIVPAERMEGGRRAVVVSGVQGGSPAEAAGMQAGDRIVRIGNRPVTDALDVERAMLDYQAGQQAEVVVRRGGKDQAVALTLQGLNANAVAATVVPTSATLTVDDQIWRSLGLKAVPVTSEYVSTVSSKFRGGLYVKAVSPGGPADRASIRAGDILVGMNVGQRDWETIRPDNLIYILSRPEVGQTQTIQYYLVRRNGFVQGMLTLADAQVPATARR
jgi:serine protease Do